jgi:hypothetical protein
VRLPKRGVEDARVRLVQGEVDRAGAIADEEDLPPGDAAILALVDAALRVRPEGVAEGGDPDDIRIGGMDADLADLARLAQPDMGPGAAGVGRAVDAVAVGDVGADRRLPRPGVDHIRIGRRHRQRPDRGRFQEPVRDRPPVRAAVGRLPDPTRHRAEVVGIGIARRPRHGHDAPAPERPDAAPAQQVVEIESLGIGCRHEPPPLGDGRSVNRIGSVAPLR